MTKHRTGDTIAQEKDEIPKILLTGEDVTSLFEIFNYGNSEQFLTTVMQITYDSMEYGQIDKGAHAEFLFHMMLIRKFLASVEKNPAINIDG